MEMKTNRESEESGDMDSKESEMQRQNFLDSMGFVTDSAQRRRAETDEIMTMLGEVVDSIMEVRQFVGMDQPQEDTGSSAMPMSPDKRKENVQAEMMQNLGNSLGIGGNKQNGQQ